MSPEARCLDCGYILLGLTESRCPECGKEFSPDDPSTVNQGRPYGDLVRWALQPTKWIAPLAPWIFAFCIAAQTLFLLDRLLTFAACGLLYTVIAVPYAARGTLRNFVVRRYRQPRELRRVDRPATRRLHIALLVAQLLALSGFIQNIAFSICAHWMWPIVNHEYQDVALDAPLPPARWIGPYRFQVEARQIRWIVVRANFAPVLFYFPDERRADASPPGWLFDYQVPLPWDSRIPRGLEDWGLLAR
jgi:hypothetical protein